jgi:hypothetical protein
MPSTLSKCKPSTQEVLETILETFHVMDPEQQEKFWKYDIARTTALIIYLILEKQKFPEAEVTVDAFVEKETINEPVRQAFLNLATTLKVKVKNGDLSDWDTLCEGLKNKMAVLLNKQTAPGQEQRKMTSTEIQALIDFRTFMVEQVKPKVERTNSADIMKAFQKFIDTMKDGQKVSPVDDMLADDSCYFGIYVPECKRDKFGSDHLTTAFGAVAKKVWLKHCGTFAQATPAKEMVTWTNPVTGLVSPYRPYLVTFKDGTTMVTHNSIHLPEGSTDYAKNHAHQEKTFGKDPQGYDWDHDKTFESLHITFQRNQPRFYIQSDFDGVLFRQSGLETNGVFDANLLHDPTTIIKSNLTEFGRKLRALKIPFRIVTSRTCKPENKKEMEANIKALYPNCLEISWGPTIKTTGLQRSHDKAVSKRQRCMQYPYMWFFDDEKINVEILGYGSVVVDGLGLVHYHGDALTGTHVAVAVAGAVGVGKTTLVNNFIAKTGAKVPHVNDDGISPLVMCEAADASAPSHLNLPFRLFATTYGNQDTFYIFDTTSSGRKDMALPIFGLSLTLTPSVFAGCFCSLMNRKDHPNLNGVGMIDLDAPPAEYMSWDTNGMNLPTFVNYLWATRGRSEVMFREAFERLGQMCKFMHLNGKYYLLTSYREGLQKWNSVWGRQNRKCVLEYSDDKWHLIKCGLEVGAELKPDSNKEDGDVYRTKLSLYQESIRRYLYLGLPLPFGTVLTSKKDGALAQTTLITERVKENYDAIMGSDNYFAQILAKVSYEAYNKKKFILISTNGTFMAAKHMWDYIVTAVACDFGIPMSELKQMMQPADPTTKLAALLTHLGGNCSINCSRKSILRRLRRLQGNLSEEQFMEMYSVELGNEFDVYQSQGGVLSAWTQLVDRFTEREMKLWAKFDFETNATHQMEAVCPNRTTCAGVVHTELAMSYPTGGFTSLGIRYQDAYLPHFTMEEHLNEVGYEQPLFWTQNDSNVILAMLTAVQRLSTDPSYTEADFLTEFPPNNMRLPKSVQVDHEGFVLLVKTLAAKGWDYGKIKTLLYYLFHKPRESTMDKLIAMSMTHELEHFPLANVIRENQRVIQGFDTSAFRQQMLDFLMQARFAPSAPKHTNRKIQGIYNQYTSRRAKMEDEPTQPNISSFTRFLYNNPGKPTMRVEAYKRVTVTYNVSYVATQYLSLLSRPSTMLSDAEKKYAKVVENSLATVASAVQNGLGNEDIDMLNKHTMYLRLNLPEV